MPTFDAGIPAPSRARLTAHLRELQGKAMKGGSAPFDPSKVAGEIRRLIKLDRPKLALRYYDQTVGNHGIEGLIQWEPGRFGVAKREWLYSNTGETYAATLIMHPGGSIRIGCWGDIAERVSNLDCWTPHYKTSVDEALARISAAE